MLQATLVSKGMRATEAASKQSLFDKAVRALDAMSSISQLEPVRLFVPGRIEFLGKHTDYAGGRSLICALERGICVIASPRIDNKVRICDAIRDVNESFDLSPVLQPPSGHWSNYPMTVARRIARDFPGARRGADIAIASDLPSAAGLSSSSVLVIAVFTVLAIVNDLSSRDEYVRSIRSNEDLAGYLGAMESGRAFNAFGADTGVGTFGGSQDHTAILCSQPGMLSQYQFCPVRLERSIRLPSEYSFVIGVSGAAAEKTGPALEKYNRASLLVSTIRSLWERASGEPIESLMSAVSQAKDGPDSIREILASSSDPNFSPKELLDRFEQFLIEATEIIPAVGDALSRGEIKSIGTLVDRSQRSAEELLGNQIAETIWLARAARDLGASAASAFGAGFGGSVWALVNNSRLDDFTSGWSGAYRSRFPITAAGSSFFATGAGPAMMRL